MAYCRQVNETARLQVIESLPIYLGKTGASELRSSLDLLLALLHRCGLDGQFDRPRRMFLSCPSHSVTVHAPFVTQLMAVCTSFMTKFAPSSTSFHAHGLRGDHLSF